MTSCKNVEKDRALDKILCPLCNNAGSIIHHLAMRMVVKEGLVKEVKEEAYFTCIKDNCDVVFYNEDGESIFLTQDINMKADFDEITKLNAHKCKGCTKED